MISLAVLIASYNRSDFTIECLKNVLKSKVSETIISIYVVDGGSTDGTVDEIRKKYPDVHLFIKDDFHWCEAMRFAWNEAAQLNFDYYLWLNDDSEITCHAIQDALDLARKQTDKVIVVGLFQDPITGKDTYGALKQKSKASPLSYKIIEDDFSTPITFNGNFVLISRYVFRLVGNLDSNYTHSFGDIDYGLRATNLGVPIFQLEKPVGVVAFNSNWKRNNESLSRENFHKILFAKKGIPINEWFHFCKEHGGIFWRLRFSFRYLRLVKNGIFNLANRKEN